MKNVGSQILKEEPRERPRLRRYHNIKMLLSDVYVKVEIGLKELKTV
jgi:hypothetical protein